MTNLNKLVLKLAIFPFHDERSEVPTKILS